MSDRQYRLLNSVLAILVLTGTLAGVGLVAASTTSIYTARSDLTGASTLTNLQVNGTGDNAYVSYQPPWTTETDSADFQQGTTTNLSIGSGSLAYDGLVVGANQTTASDFSGATLTNMSVSGSGSSASVVYSSSSASGASKWTFDGAGSTATDSWGSNDVQLSSGVSRVSGVSGSAINFSSGKANTSHGYDFSNGFSISTWVRVRGSTGSRQTILDYTWGSADTNYYASVGYDSGQFLAHVRGGGGSTSSSTTITGGSPSYGSWYLVTLTGNSTGSLSLFVNGSVVASDTSTFSSLSGFSNPSYQTWMGNVKHTASNQYLKGSVDDARTYLTPLKSFQISNLYQSRGGDLGASSATYLSAPMTVDSVASAWANLKTLNNASASINVQQSTDGGSSWTDAGLKSSISTPGNYSVNVTGSGEWRFNITLTKNGSNAQASISDDGILFSQQGTYQSSPHSLSGVSQAHADLSLSGATATVTWQGSQDGSTWNNLVSQTYSTNGTHALSLSSNHQYYRAKVDFNYQSGSGTATLNELGWTAQTAGTYVGKPHAVSNASSELNALKIANGSVTVYAEGSNDGSTWTTVGSKTYTSSTDLSSINTTSSYSEYRTRAVFQRNSSNQPVTGWLYAEGFASGGGVVVHQVNTTITKSSNSTPLLVAVAGDTAKPKPGMLSKIESVLPKSLTGWLDRYIANLKGGWKKASAAQQAREIQAEYNGHSQAYTSYLNKRLASSSNVNISDYDTIRINVTVNGNSSTLYWVGLRNGNTYAATQIVNSTDRHVDSSVTIQNYAAVQADTELANFRSEYVVSGDAPSRTYVDKVLSKYGPDVHGPLINQTQQALAA